MNVREAVLARYSTRNYVVNAPVSHDKIELILEAGMFAPNGLALEPWKFEVLTGDMNKLKEATYGQQHIQDASFVIALVNYKKELIVDQPEIMADKWKKSGLTEQQISDYLGYAERLGTQYCREQLMFAASQMVLQAVELELGSVVVGGYDADKMAEILSLDTNYYEVGLLISFGVNADSGSKQRIRRNKEEVIKFHQL